MARGTRRAIAALTAAAVAGDLLLVALLVWLAGRLPARFGGDHSTLTTDTTIIILLFGAVQGICLVASMVALAAESWLHRERMSRLYWPIFAVKATFTAEVLILAARAFDFLAHRRAPHWMALYAPGVYLLTNVLLLAVIASMTWLHVAMLAVWGWQRHRLTVLVLAILGTTAILTAAAVLYAHLAR